MKRQPTKTNLGIQTKLVVGFFVSVLLVSSVVAYIGIHSNKQIDQGFSNMTSVNVPSIIALLEMQSAARQASIKAMEYALESVEKDKLKTLEALDKIETHLTNWQQAGGEDAELTTVIEAQANALASVVNATLALIDTGGTFEQVLAQLENIHTARKELINTLYDQIDLEYEELGAAATRNEQTIASGSRNIVLASVLVALLGISLGFWISRSITQPLNQLTQVATRTAAGHLEQTVHVSSEDEIGVLADAFRQVIGYQREMAGAASELAQGDLTVEVAPRSSEDVLGNAFAQMITNLRNLVGQVTDSANGVGMASGQLTATADQAAQASNQIATTVQQVAAGTSQQTESVTITSTTVEQLARSIDGVAKGAREQAASIDKSSEISARISAVVQQVAANAQAGAQSAAQAAQAARDGAETVEKTVESIESIKSSTDLVAKRVREMGRRSEQIGNIIRTIDDIASQTNLLALNATIEAARAGEHGKGFAVVADEVRKLAENATGATQEIAGLIKEVQRTTAEAVQAMSEGSAEVEAGMVQAGEAGQALDSILIAAEAVNRQVNEIASAAQQMDASANELVSAMDSVSAVVEENTAATADMAAGADEVTQAMESIASISEENSASSEQVSVTVEEVSAQVEEVTASAQSLSGMAEGLQALVAQFKLPDTATSQRQPVPAMSHLPVPLAFDRVHPELGNGGNGQ